MTGIQKSWPVFETGLAKPAIFWFGLPERLLIFITETVKAAILL